MWLGTLALDRLGGSQPPIYSNKPKCLLNDQGPEARATAHSHLFGPRMAGSHGRAAS